MHTGTIVTPINPAYTGPYEPAGRLAGETIVGVILRDAPVVGGRPGEYFDVLWLSDRRGAFVCTEWHTDITAAPLNERADITDEKINHWDLALLVRQATGHQTLPERLGSRAEYLNTARRVRRLVALPIHSDIRELHRLLDEYENAHPNERRHDDPVFEKLLQLPERPNGS